MSAETLSPVVYFGVELPAAGWARVYRGLVVLRRFHPLVTSGSFGDAFPLARRFISVAPTLVGSYAFESEAGEFNRADLAKLHCADAADAPTRFGDASANPAYPAETQISNHLDRRRGAECSNYRGAGSHLMLPHLKSAGWLADAVAEAVSGAALAGVDGLFISDIAQLVRTDRQLAVRYLTGVEARTTAALVLDGGLSVLDHVTRLEAVVLSDLDHDYSSPLGRRILRDAAPALKGAKARGVKIHRVEHGATQIKRIPRTVERLVDTTTSLPQEQANSWEPWYRDWEQGPSHGEPWRNTGEPWQTDGKAWRNDGEPCSNADKPCSHDAAALIIAA